MDTQLAQRLHFSLMTFAAAMLALYVAMSIDLQQPYWSMMTVFIVSQPLAAAVRSKALQRLLGTLLGACAAVILVPRLANTPALLCLAMALWVGGCLTLSVLDRSPSSYGMMLAGYTAAIIGFGSVNQPGEVFTVALARSEEIILGALCASLLHSLWFPRPVGDVIHAHIAAWWAEADRWALDLLDEGGAVTGNRDRMRLAAAANELHQLATHLPYDTSRLREATAVVRALHDRMLLLIPILASLSDRLSAMRTVNPQLDQESRDAMAAARAWIASADPCSVDPPTAGPPSVDSERAATDVPDRLAADTRAPTSADWYAMNRIGMLTRLHDLLDTLGEGRSLLAALHAPAAALPESVHAMLRKTEARPMHSDLALALLSGSSAVIAISIACTAWIALGWTDDAASAIMAGILCCLFAATDDPAPSIKVFGTSLLLAVPLAAIYRFVVFPAIDSFAMLALSLAPMLLGIGVLVVTPGRALLALVTLLNFCNSMAIQERINSDFAQFVNGNLSQFFGVFVAIFVTRTLRSLSAESSARRLLAQTWRQLALLARADRTSIPADFASRMVDRLTLLAPRLAEHPDPALSGIDALDELRVGMDIVVLQAARSELSAPVRAQVGEVLEAAGEYYSRRSRHHDHDSAPLVRQLDRAIRSMSEPARHARALTALLGLRSKLSPAWTWTAAEPLASSMR